MVIMAKCVCESERERGSLFFWRRGLGLICLLPEDVIVKRWLVGGGGGGGLKKKTCYCFAGSTNMSPNYEICIRSAYYLLNPGGDLQTTQKKFESFFRRQKRWHGIVGEAPAEKDILEELASSDMFVYMGHGGGEQYVSYKELFKLERCAPGRKKYGYTFVVYFSCHVLAFVIFSPSLAFLSI